MCAYTHVINLQFVYVLMAKVYLKKIFYIMHFVIVAHSVVNTYCIFKLFGNPESCFIKFLCDVCLLTLNNNYI